jgi:DUF1009 family protein
LTITLDKIQGLIAGDGELPAKFVESAKKSGFKVITISLSPDNRNELNRISDKVYVCGPGEIQKVADFLHKENVRQVTFIGKVNKGMLFRNPRLDSRALRLLRENLRLNDNAVMLALINELKIENIDVIDQTIFIKELLVPKGVVGKVQPDENQKIDIEYGYNLAKEIGKLDIGQTVVVQNKMVLAVEAIEGTDRAIRRGCGLGKKNATVVKVSKPAQDKRFDIPAVGLKTLKVMKKCGAKVLAIEAGETFILQKEEVIKFADKNNIVVVAV